MAHDMLTIHVPGDIRGKAAKDPVWLTVELLRSRLSYDPVSGLFRWIANADMRPAWNGRYAGTLAGSPTTNGYIKISLLKKDIRAHRLAWLHVHGRWPHSEIDHINGFRTDNRLCNLREATVAENRRNKVGNLNNPNPKGVMFRKINRRWIAAIWLNGKNVHIGCFDTSDEAHAAYAAMAKKHFGSFARAS